MDEKDKQMNAQPQTQLTAARDLQPGNKILTRPGDIVEVLKIDSDSRDGYLVLTLEGQHDSHVRPDYRLEKVIEG